MESLAAIAALVFLFVAASGPLAVAMTLSGYVYIGGTLGIIAVPVGLWWFFLMSGPVAYVGLASGFAGGWATLQAWRASCDNS